MTTDAETIPPALTAEEWARRAKMEHDPMGDVGVRVDAISPDEVRLTVDAPDATDVEAPPALLPALIALANDALKDDDKRKITRAHVALLRKAVIYEAHGFCDEPADVNTDATDALGRLADALESYLPPE